MGCELVATADIIQFAIVDMVLHATSGTAKQKGTVDVAEMSEIIVTSNEAKDNIAVYSLPLWFWYIYIYLY